MCVLIKNSNYYLLLSAVRQFALSMITKVRQLYQSFPETRRSYLAYNCTVLLQIEKCGEISPK